MLQGGVSCVSVVMKILAVAALFFGWYLSNAYNF